MYPEILVLYIYSYLAGSVPTPYIIARLGKGIDLRQYGSGNVGGSNVIRQMGKRWMIPLAAAEFLLKGLSPVILGFILLDQMPGLHSASPQFLIAPLLALVGNNWSVFLRLQGGRGLMVICGMVIALAPLLFVIAFSVYVIGWRVSRSSAVWALIAVALLPLLAVSPGGYLAMDWASLVGLLTGGGFPQAVEGHSGVISWFCGAILALVVLKRILANTLEFPEGMPRSKVVFNRVFRDRDVDDQATWVGRVPD